MPTLVAGLYPELFAAVGVHSGLASGAANDVLSALHAMRRGAVLSSVADQKQPVMPTIVFHGSADKTVHPENGDQVVDAALAALEGFRPGTEKTQRAEGGAGGPSGDSGNGSGRSVLRTVYSGADGKSLKSHGRQGLLTGRAETTPWRSSSTFRPIRVALRAKSSRPREADGKDLSASLRWDHAETADMADALGLV